MTKQFKSIALVLLAIIVPNVASAKYWYGPPREVILAIQITIVVLGLGLNILISRLIKFMFEKYRNEKRTHSWFQITLGLLFVLTFLIVQENWEWFKNMLISICNDEYFPNPFILISFSVLSVFFGSILGYFITPIKKLID